MKYIPSKQAQQRAKKEEKIFKVTKEEKVTKKTKSSIKDKDDDIQPES